MRTTFLVPFLLACICLPLSATIVTLEEFAVAGVPAGWSTAIGSGYGISIPGTGDAVFSRSPGAPSGSAKLTYNTSISGDFFAVGVLNGYSLVNGTAVALEADWTGGSDRFSVGLRQVGGEVQQVAGNSRTMEFPWAPWSWADAIPILFRTGNNIQAGIMSGVPDAGGVPDFSGFTPLGSWTGDQYLGDVILSLSFGCLGCTGAASVGVDIFALAVPPYAPDMIPPGAAEIPEPATAGLLGAGMAAILLLRRRRTA